jgi:exopolysaccharide biosynthesis polyprenyl glycosylphosphotransferase
VTERVAAASLRSLVVGVSLAGDIAVTVVSYLVALALWGVVRGSGIDFTLQPDWSLPVLVVTLVATFMAVGAYKVEAFVSRPLHLWTILKGTTIALVITAFVAFAFHAQATSYSRGVLFGSFVLLFILLTVVRFAVIDARLVRGRLRALGDTLVIGQSTESGLLASRLRELRGYNKLRCLALTGPVGNGYGAEPAALAAIAEGDEPPAHVFLDAGGMGHVALLELLEAARKRGAEVYIVSRYLGPLDSTGLLVRLFELPVMRVRHEPHERRGSVAKRVVDVAGSAVALVLLSPVFLVLAIVVKLSSPGPVFFRQRRVGLDGEPFGFIKFRSMRHGNDPSEHVEALNEFIQGEREALVCTDEDGLEVLKLADDPRITRVGSYLRKFSLDELPQLFNVLRGDMSLVGPRPPLDYEVTAYKDWHRRRLLVTPGMTGLWQVMGRSRVSFDEMVFEDVMYSYNQSLLTDAGIMLRTIPVVLTARGAA